MAVNLVNERSENQGLRENLSFLEIDKTFFLGGNEGLVVLIMVFGHDKPILPDTVALVSPKSYDFHGLALELLGLSLHNVLHDLSEITHVEHVMEFLGRRSELGVLAHIREYLLSSCNDLRGQLLDVVIKLSEMVLQQLSVNGTQNFLFRDGQADCSQMSGKSDIDEEGSGLGVHAADEHNILHSLLDR